MSNSTPTTATEGSRRRGMTGLIASMLIFGTIGIFRKNSQLPSALLAFWRGVIGTLFLLLFVRLTGRKTDRTAVRGKLGLLILSGAMLGFNWILLFEAYNYTSVAVATLCYYMQPIFVMLAAPILLKEKLTVKKAVCVVAALAGMSLVSGFWDGSRIGAGEIRGILLGLGAAALYAGVVLLNTRMRELEAYDKTICQLGSAAAVLLPYMLLTGQFNGVRWSGSEVCTVILLGIVHTGVAYALYFASMRHLKAQTVALFSYIDPISAVLLSALFLKEPMGPAQIVATVLVLGAVMISEM